MSIEMRVGPLFKFHWSAIPGKRPAPVHTDFVVRVELNRRFKFMLKDLSLVLNNSNRKPFILAGPIGIANPDFIVAGTRYVNILIDSGTSLVGTRGN